MAQSLSDLLKGRKIIVALNSEPYAHRKVRDTIKVQRGSGGAQHLLDYIMKKTGGIMIAIGSGEADKEVVDENNNIQVPPDNPKYTLQRIFLSKEQLDNYYYGFSNQTLWPLCHLAFEKPVFRQEWWETYKEVNQIFADEILNKADDNTFVWVNDYQMCLVPQMLKKANPSLKVGTFWHIPWPIKELFSICPWSRELVEGLIYSDFIGFHQDTYVQNFMDTAMSEVEINVRPSSNSLFYDNHKITIGKLPAGIDYEEIRQYVHSIDFKDNPIKHDFEFDYEKLIIGVDRIDYTKGLIERLNVLDRFFETYPDYHMKVTHLMIGSPSRTYIPAYKQLAREVKEKVDEINWKYGQNGWKPIYYVDRAVDPNKVYQYYHFADVCIVSSLDDGMNLVAKEYPICVKPSQGALLVSKYAGASKELKEAFQINPYNIKQSVETLHVALTMSSTQRLKKIEDMRKTLQNNNIEYWAKEFIQKTLNGD